VVVQLLLLQPQAEAHRAVHVQVRSPAISSRVAKQVCEKYGPKCSPNHFCQY
jgi:hypothetical protein